MRIAMGVSCGYPALLSLLWTISYAETYHGTPEGDMNFQTELVGESSCAIRPTTILVLPPGGMLQVPWLRDSARIAPLTSKRLARYSCFSPSVLPL